MQIRLHNTSSKPVSCGISSAIYPYYFFSRQLEECVSISIDRLLQPAIASMMLRICLLKIGSVIFKNKDRDQQQTQNLAKRKQVRISCWVYTDSYSTLSRDFRQTKSQATVNGGMSVKNNGA